MDAIYQKKIFVFFKYLRTVYKDNEKSKGNLLDLLIMKSRNNDPSNPIGTKGLSVLAKEMEREETGSLRAEFGTTGDGVIVIQFFGDNDTSGEKPVLS
jgi:hypothetical protein